MDNNIITQSDGKLEGRQPPPVSTADAFHRIHRDALVDVADNMRISVDQVHKLYSIILDKLSDGARIRDYLPILATKKVKDLMRKKMEIKNGFDMKGGMHSQ